MNMDEKEIMNDVQETETPAPAVETSVQKKSKKRLNTRKLRFGTTSVAITAVFVVAVLLLNIIVNGLSARYPLSIDLSEDKVYTMTDDSKAVAESVKEEVNIVVFAGEQLFSQSTVGASSYGVPEYDTMLLEFYNILKQYASHSNGLVKYSFIDPNQNPTEYASYQQLFEVEAAEILLHTETQSRIIAVEDLFSIEYSETDYESYTFESKVESVLAAAINSLIGGETHTVIALTGHNEDEKLIAALKNLYELNGYLFVEHNLSGSEEFDERGEIMLIAAPQFDYSADQIKRINNWMKNGENYERHLMVYTHLSASCPNLYEMLEVDYKIAVTDQVILETDLERVYSGSYQANAFHTLTDVAQTEFTKNSASTAQVFAPFSRRLVTSLGAKDEESAFNIYGLKLNSFPSSTKIMTIEKLNFLEQGGSIDQDKDLLKLSDDSYPLTSMVAYVSELYNNTTEKTVRSTVVVCGTPNIGYADNIKQGNFKNEELLLDVFNSMVNAKERVRISTKTYSSDSVYFNPRAQLIIGYGVFIIGIPLIIVIICLVVFLRRKNL